MQLQARLVHADNGSRVVEVSAHRDGTFIASALGEAANAEAAEDRALARLQQRLAAAGAPAAPPARIAPPPPRQDASQPPTDPEPQPMARPLPPPQPPAAPPGEGERPGPSPEAGMAGMAPLVEEPAPDPEDWSSELAQIDLELRRLGWQREQESLYLERAFGHPSRSRLTSYADLRAYLQALADLAEASDPAQAPVPLRRRDLLNQCDQLLAQLRWDAQRGRRHLEEHFGQSSRQNLSDTQLLQFNMLLEEALLEAAQ